MNDEIKSVIIRALQRDGSQQAKYKPPGWEREVELMDAAIAAMNALGEQPQRLLLLRDQPTYLYDDGSCGWLIAGPFTELCYALKNAVEQLENDEMVEFNIKRHDMTQEEIDAAPEV
jgi:hypothetical protein